MSSRVMHLAVLAGLALSESSFASVTIHRRNELVGSDGSVYRRDAIDQNINYAQDHYFNSFDGSNTATPDAITHTTSASGAINDTATNTQLVASGQGAAAMSSTVSYAGADLVKLDSSGSYSTSFTT